MTDTTTTATITMDDVYGEGPPIKGAKAEATEGAGIDILLDCCDGNANFGSVVWIENRRGIPYVCVWADQDSEDPTHTISLEKAMNAGGAAC